MSMDFGDDGEGGVSIADVREYTIVTREMVEGMEKYDNDDRHPAEDELRAWGSDVAAKRKENTAETYYRAVKPLVCWLDLAHEVKVPSSVDSRIVNQYANWLMTRDWGRETREARFNATQQLFGFLHEQGYTKEDYADGLTLEDWTVEPGAIEESRGGFGRDGHKWISREKVFDLWQKENVTSPASRDSLLFKLMWFTMARPAGIADMRISPTPDEVDDPETEMVRWNREEGWFRIRGLKRGKDEDLYRQVFYPAKRLNPVIDEWLRRRSTLGPHHEDSDHLFLTHQKPRMRPSHISRKVKQAARNAGHQSISGYDVDGDPRWSITAKTIRHSAITWLVNQAEVPATIVKEQAGHSKLETTMTYVHSDDETLRERLNTAWQ